MLRFYPRMVMAPAGEISGGNAPEVKANYQDIYDNGDPNETFDNLDYESPASKQTGEDYKETFKERIEKAKKLQKEKDKASDEDEDEDEEEEKPKAKKEKKEKKEEEKKPEKKKSDIDTLSDKEDGVDDEKEPKKAKKDSEEEEESEEESSKEKEEEEKSLDKNKNGKIKIRMDDGLYGVDPTATIRHKVDGEYVETTIQDLINQKSGEIAYDKKFTELGKQKKEIELKASQVEKKAEVLTKTVGDVLKIVNDPNANIWDALHFLVDKSGGDVYSVKRRAMESVLEEVEKLQSMNESEVKAYWLEEKDRIRTKADEARKKVYDEEQSFNQAVQKVDSLRQAHGVSEDQFLQALDDLEGQGVDTKKMTDEQVVDYASLKPHLDSVQDVLEPYEAQIDDSQYEEVVRDFAKQLRAKKLTLDQLKQIAKKEFMDEDLKDLTSRAKISTKPSKSAPKKESKKEYESFDDFDD